MTEKRRTPKVLLFLLNPEGNPTPVDRPFEDPATPKELRHDAGYRRAFWRFSL